MSNPRPGRPRKHRTCMVPGCERDHIARGYCHTHYQRWRRHGHPGGPGIREYDGDRTCERPGCTRPHRADGLCERHYQRRQKRRRAEERRRARR